MAWPLLALPPLSACATVGARPVADGGAVGVGRTAHVGRLLATPEHVVEDSRCPAEVQCVWAGRLIVSTRIEGANWHESAPLTLGKAYATHGTVITLVSAAPARKSDAPIVEANYRFTFDGGG